ncbi:MAG TPA: hypothetical protein VFU97_24420 [Xanthobacteraceae bacterium]|nr:hypothetical protein [Xanthobacteraceae bacterium]
MNRRKIARIRAKSKKPEGPTGPSHVALRDFFVAAMLPELLKHRTEEGTYLLPESVAILAYRQADALMAERSR